MLHPVASTPLRILGQAPPRFGRKPDDMPLFTKTLTQGCYQALGKHLVAQVIFEDSMPTRSAHRDRGIGSLATSGAKQLMQFMKQMGFNTLQQGPAGLQGFTPYQSSRFALNPWFIPVKPLATEKWGNLLTPEDLQTALDQNPTHGTNRIDRGYIYHSQKALLNEAFRIYKIKYEHRKDYPRDKQALERIHEEFEAFKRTNTCPNHNQPTPLERNAIFSALAMLNQDENKDNWPERDRNLFGQVPMTDEVKARLAQVREEGAETIERDFFIQYLAKAFRQIGLDNAKAAGLKVYGDMTSVVFSRDEWAYQHLFLPGLCLGIPEEPGLPNGGMWHGAVLNPDLLLTTDPTTQQKTCGATGQWIKLVLETALSHAPAGLRFDHFVGWVDPWVYDKTQTAHSTHGGTRLRSTPGDGLAKNGTPKAQLAAWAIATPAQIDTSVPAGAENRVKWLDEPQVKRYGRMLALVNSVLNQTGKSLKDCPLEDLGKVTTPVRAVMEAMDLPRMRVSMFRGDEASDYHPNQYQPKDWVMHGTHDHTTVWQTAQNDIEAVAKNTPEASAARIRVAQLGAFLFPLQTLEENKARKAFEEKALKEVSTRVHGEMAMVFASRAQNIQMTMSDFFGLPRFNDPNTTSNDNFTLRLTSDFEKRYYDAVSQGRALNMPEVLLMALHARGLDTKEPGLVTLLESFKKTLNETP